jgi:hypothetical protein
LQELPTFAQLLRRIGKVLFGLLSGCSSPVTRVSRLSLQVGEQWLRQVGHFRLPLGLRTGERVNIIRVAGDDIITWGKLAIEAGKFFAPLNATAH